MHGLREFVEFPSKLTDNMAWFLYLPSFIVLALMWVIPKYLKFRRIQHYLDRIPGTKIHGIPGDLGILLKQNWDVRKKMEISLQGFTRLFPNEGIISARLFTMPFVLLYKPETVECILSGTSTLNKSPEYGLVRPWLGNGLITSDRVTWKKHRKILTPAFHFRILDHFIPIVNEQAKVLVDKLQDHCKEPWIDVLHFTLRCTLDVICETSMGVKLGAQSNKEQEYINALKYVQKSFLYRSMYPWLRSKLVFYALPSGRKYLKQLSIIREFTKKVVRQRKTEKLKNGWEYDENFLQENKTSSSRPRLALLDLLLHYHIHDQVLTEEEVQDEVNTFMFAGHDTTGQAIAWTFYLLGLHPDIQDKVHMELDDVFGSDKDRDVTSDDLKMLKYLECTIKESQRLYPPVPILGRRIRKDMVIDGHFVPEGVSSIILLRTLHRNPCQFPQPERFIPERFLPENCVGRHPYAFVPFSAGPRNCIGQRFAMNEEKIVLSTVLRKFSVVSLDKPDQLIVRESVLLQPKGPLRMKFQSR